MHIPFQAIDWRSIPKTEHPGLHGTATWQTIQFPGLRIRRVHYSADYQADHWCEKGHYVHCLEGEFESDLHSGEKFILIEGQSYIVSDGLSSHRSHSANGAMLLIIDGDFLQA
jgi:quercetin dioxygenase-like cupin family protein